MVKKLLVFGFLSLVLIGYAIYDFAKKAPADLYEKAINGEIKSEWYAHNNLHYLLSPEFNQLKGLEVQDPEWWRRIRIADFKFPLPYRHPLYRVRPILDQKNGYYGLSFTDNQDIEMIRLFFKPVSYFGLKTPEKKFFEIPFVNYVLSEYSQNEVWGELFVRKVPRKLQSLKRGIKDLYLLEQRLAYFPENFAAFGQVEDREDTFYIKAASEDKDYHREIFFQKRQSQIFSFELYTLRNFQSAAVFREHVIKNFELSPSSQELRMISYAEFERLSRDDKQDEVGFIHLFSTWSQKEKKSLVQEMIYYAEKNPDLTKVLNILYNYSVKKYGKMYSHHRDIYLKLDDKMSLQRKIELEEKRLRKAALDPEDYIPPESVDRSQTLKEKLRRARQMKKKGDQYRVN